MKRSNIKKARILLLISAFFASCTSAYQPIGKVSILSSRPVKPGVVYKQLTTNSGASKKEMKRSKAEDVDDAVKQLISKVSGGSFITNVTIYMVDNSHYAVSGNVWGATGDTLTHYFPGTIVSSNSANVLYAHSQSSLKLK